MPLTMHRLRPVLTTRPFLTMADELRHGLAAALQTRQIALVFKLPQWKNEP
jgi:hypothetical protein